VRNPETVSGRVWLQRHYEELQRFVMSLRKDEDALAEAVRSLRYLLEREPEYAREARQLTLHCALGNWNAGFPRPLLELVSVGLDAEVMSTDLEAEPVPGNMLLLLLADSQLLAAENVEAFATLNRLADRPSASGPAAEWVRARVALLRAELDELDREVDRARAGFEAARDSSRPLLEDQLPALLDDWVIQVFGPRDETIVQHVTGLEGTAGLLLAQTYVSAILGLLRTTVDDVALASLAEAARTAIEAHGLSKPPGAFEMADALAALRPNLAHALGEQLRDSVCSAVDDLMASGLAAGLDPELVEMIRATGGAGGDERVRTTWDIVTGVAVARGAERLGELQAAGTAYKAALTGAIESHLALPVAYAAGAYAAFAMRYEPDAEHVGPLTNIFLGAFENSVAVEPDVLRDARLRALFDSPISLLTRRTLEEPGVLDDPGKLRRLSVLLDLLRSREAPRTAGLSGFEGGAPASEVSQGLDEIANALMRIVLALDGSTGTLVLVSQGLPDDQRFLVIDGNGISVHATGVEYANALDALDAAAEQAVFAASAGATGETDALADAGRRAFDALPAAVREALVEADVLLLANDFQAEDAETPFELFHDGDQHLLTGVVSARFTSLQHLARTLDSSRSRRARRRALVTAAPTAIPSRPLYAAQSESAAVGAALEGVGYDVPRIAEERLTAKFFTDRLSYVDVLHVAAHGESTAGVEFVALPDGRRLSVDDLLARRQRSMPFTYLNTCRLGRTRYLGGGRSRGVAYTLSDLDAPTVLANTTDVLDEASTAVATAFYAEAATRPVGDALREARKQVVASGANPTLVARVILYGDPWHSIGEAAEHELDDPADDLLDAYLATGTDDDRLRAWTRATEDVELGMATPRLLAALALVRGLSEVESPDEVADRQLDMIEEAIALADALHHPEARAMLRVVRTQYGNDDAAASEWLRDAIRYLEPLRDAGDVWQRLELDLRAKLRRRELDSTGLEITHMGPGADQEDPELNAFVDVLLATQQASEDERGRVSIRPRENSFDDIMWNAVVVGHPNRFQDVAEAASFCRLLTRKLIARDHLPAEAEPYAQPILTGLLWFLWSSQKTTYLEPELAEGQAKTLASAVRDVAATWSPPPQKATWSKALAAFSGLVDEVLAFLDEQPEERVHEETVDQVTKLREQADAVLERLAGTDVAAAAAAYVTGILAIKNRYSPLDGSVPEYKHEKLTGAVWALNGANKSRLMPYLMEGSESVRNAEPDELERWRLEQAADTAAER
jgi:hypothetical protein